MLNESHRWFVPRACLRAVLLGVWLVSECKTEFTNELKESILLTDLSPGMKGQQHLTFPLPFPKMAGRNLKEMKSHSRGAWWQLKAWVIRPQAWCRGLGFFHTERMNC